MRIPPFPISRQDRICPRPDWDITAPGQRDAWERGDKSAFWPYGLSLREVFAADPSEG